MHYIVYTKDKLHALHLVYQGQISCTTSCNTKDKFHALYNILRTNFIHYTTDNLCGLSWFFFIIIGKQTVFETPENFLLPHTCVSTLFSINAFCRRIYKFGLHLQLILWHWQQWIINTQLLSTQLLSQSISPFRTLNYKEIHREN